MSTGASKPEVRPLAEIISDLKSALGMTVTQGLYGMGVRGASGGRTRWFWPRPNVRGQYDRNAGVARIRVVTDIEAIAHEGGHHLERAFAPHGIEAFKTQHAEELAVPPVPDTPLPAVSPTGFSGIELDADTQRVLVEAANRTREWWQLAAQPKTDRSILYQAAADAAIARRTLQRRLGRTVADALLADLVGDAALPNNGILGRTPHRLAVSTLHDAIINPSMLADYVRERYSATGTPQPRVAPTPSATEISEGFATFFQRYITDPDNVKREMPGVYTAFEDFLDANDPAMLEDFERVQLTVLSEDYKAYRSTVQHTQPAVSSRWRFLLQMMRRVQESVLKVDRRWVAVVLLGLLILLAVWWMLPHERDRWIRRDGTLACPNEAEIESYRRYDTPSWRHRMIQDAVQHKECTTLMAKERVRVQTLSTDGSRARVRRHRDGAQLWIAVPDLLIRQP